MNVSILVSRVFLCSFLSLSAIQTRPGFHPRFVVWNVGQGQWATWITEDECVHFDMGGDFAPKNQIRHLCRHRINRLYLSHADLDHIRFIPWAVRHLRELCIWESPRERISPQKAEILRPIPLCLREHEPSRHKSVRALEIRPDKNWKSNDQSRVYSLSPQQRRAVLLPGDSTDRAEKLWIQSSKGTRWHLLLTGHHGSRTSTSELLMQRLKDLKQAVVSARKKRYGHPHPLVLERLRRHRVAVLRTEIWGSIVTEL